MGPVALEEAVPVRVGLPGGADRGHGGRLGQVGKGHVAVVEISLGSEGVKMLSHRKRSVVFLWA